jgi:hypothetical protein
MAIARTRRLAAPASHPGEMLKDELEARGLSPHALAIALPLLASESAGSFAASERLRRKPRCASPAISAARRRSGCAFRWPMTSRAPKPNSLRRSRLRSRQPPPNWIKTSVVDVAK